MNLPLWSHAVTERDCLRHRLVAATPDPRVVIAACGIRIAVIGLPRCARGRVRPCPEEP